jgi:hypothetical protein
VLDISPPLEVLPSSSVGLATFEVASAAMKKNSYNLNPEV